MRVIDFNGFAHIINFKKHSREPTNRSSLHEYALELMKKRFPMSSIYEEVSLIGCKGVSATLTADLMLPHYPLIVEVHGQQHYEYSPFFHKSKAAFENYCKNDDIKKSWAKLNDIAYLELPYYEKDNWAKIIYESL